MNKIKQKLKRLYQYLIYKNTDEVDVFIKSGWDYNRNYWEKNGVRFKHVYSSIYDTFIREDYKFLNVKDKNVLDIGAFIGDSPIYFILKGAKKVYAIEPHPDAYNEMLEKYKIK